jgi:hypothetical protein
VSPDRFTCNTVILDSLPILKGLQPHTCQCTATNNPDIIHNTPPHLLIVPSVPTLPLTPPQPQQLHMSTKLDIPALSGSLDVFTVNGCLNLCQDLFKVHAMLNTTVLKLTIQIVLAGIKIEAPMARNWWNKNHEELKVLAMWDNFARRVREHFVPANWRMDALASFYMISQSSTSFTDFATKLQEAHNTLSTGSTGFTISESVLKNHLLFFCHPILPIQIFSIPTFDYPKTWINSLITVMSATWDSVRLQNV